MSDEELVRFDETTRHVWPSHDDHSGDPFLDAALSSFHPSGFIREDAIERLAGWRNGRELRFLLLRVNDWVPQVRDAARTAVVARLTPGYAPHFARHLGLITRLQRSRRVDHSGLLRAISRLLATSVSRDALIQMMNDHRGETRRVILRILVESNPDDMELFRAMLRVDDPVIRLMAMRLLPVAENRDALEVLFDDPAGSVRAQALLMAADSPRLVSALLDRNANVRSVARHRLRDEGIDFAALYRNALNSDRAAAAIAGLSETGIRADVESIAPFLSHPRSTVRRAAIRAVMALGGDDYVDRVTELLCDRSRGVSSQARRSLMPHGSSMQAAKLWEMYESASEDHVWRNLLALMTALPKWESITLYVRATQDRAEARADLARRHVAQWNTFFNRRSSVPNARQLEALDTALSESSLDAGTVTVVRFGMRPFR
ncbi:MAG TPA: hypothetical protein VFV49_03315 [Thermoanaerobaculia bacterium]|nr:hypothetical protein [Thermoanaerobaculia bacterium]